MKTRKKLIFGSILVITVLALTILLVSTPWFQTRMEYATLIWEGQHTEDMEMAVRLHLEDYGWEVRSTKYLRTNFSCNFKAC